jgi:hypothetical protein
MMRRLLVLGAALAAFGACGGGNNAKSDGGIDAKLEGFDQPDIVCPGGPTCASTGDGVLKVGAGKRTYTPTGFETYTDENMDRQYQKGEPFTDLNGNGVFDGVWLFGGGRAAEGVASDVEVRALAFVEGDVTVVVAYVDCIGLLAGDMDNIRNDPRLAGLDIDHIIIGATHAHDAPDLVGLWGPDLSTSGRQPFVIQSMYDSAVGAITDAVQNAKPAQLVIATTHLINDPTNPASKTDLWNQDIRDPIIFDPTITIARFVDASNPTSTIGTLVNWADHPEVAHFDDTVPAAINAHYPHWLRDHIDQGVLTTESIYATQNLAGLGGVTVFVQGALGGQIGSIRGTHPPGPTGTPVTMESTAMDQAIGTNAAARALTALRDTGESVSDLPLSMVSATYAAKVENNGFQLAFIIHVLGPHVLEGYNPDDPVGPENTPWIPLRATYLQIGPIGLVTTPGELHPELWVGGYDGSWSWGWPMLKHAGTCSDTHADCNTQETCTSPATCVPTANLPDFTMAPQGPYMRDLVLAHTGVKYPILAGLAEDYIGYIVPAYNYVLSPTNPYLSEADGDHYEETYSLGPLVEQQAIHPILQLLQYR